MPHRALSMIPGTGSNVGKSMLVAGCGRAAKRPRSLCCAVQAEKHVEQRPPSPTMAGDWGPPRQALQADCLRRPYRCNMNPILRQPEPGTGSQVSCRDTATATLQARDFQSKARAGLMAPVLESFGILDKRRFDIVEGAQPG